MSQLLKAKIDTIEEGLRTLAERLREIEKAYQQMPQEAKVELELDPKEIGSLPWKLYREGHRSGWIFANQSRAERLAEAIRSSQNGRVKVGDFEYQFSGDQHKFISRRPLKEG